MGHRVGKNMTDVDYCIASLSGLCIALIHFAGENTTREAIVKFGRLASDDAKWKMLLKSYGLAEANAGIIAYQVRLPNNEA
jgi:hypothetical protein